MRGLRILVCGCSSGIGEYLFNYYKEYGCMVSGISRTKEHICDCTDPVRVRDVIREISPDILINCMGQASMNLAVMSSMHNFEHVVTNNLKSTFLVCRESARVMLRKKWGRIINFGSCTQAMEIEGESLYTASKCGMYGFSRVLARELAPNITVNMVSPGPVRTRLIGGVPEDKIQKIVDRQIIKKMATFEDIKNIVDFLISHESESVTGQNIYINGAG